MVDYTLDPTKSEAFAGKMMNVLNSASTALMISIGHQTNLFDVLAGLPPVTSTELAQAAGLNERYVREWLGAMTTGGIVEHDPHTNTYWLPPEHAAWTTRAAGPNNLGMQMQFVPLMASVEQGIIASFRNGGGVPYAGFPHFHSLMAEVSGVVHDTALVGAIVPLVPGLAEALARGIKALDIGCGQGHAANLLAKAYPASRFKGYDFSQEAIAAAKAEAAALGLGNVSFEVKDLAIMHEPGQYDLITGFDVIHDQAQPARVLDAVSQALKPDGVFLMVDIRASSHVHENIEHPLGPFLYTVSTMHCMTVSLALDGAGLGTVWGEQKARDMLAAAGFTQVDIKHVDGDILNNYYICRK